MSDFRVRLKTMLRQANRQEFGGNYITEKHCRDVLFLPTRGDVGIDRCLVSYTSYTYNIVGVYNGKIGYLMLGRIEQRQDHRYVLIHDYLVISNTLLQYCAFIALSEGECSL